MKKLKMKLPIALALIVALTGCSGSTTSQSNAPTPSSTPIVSVEPSVEPSIVPTETPVAATPAPTISTVTEAPVVEYSTTDTTQEAPIETTVYVTKTGSKYHRAGCRYLRQSQIAISLSDAKAESYTACSVCNPPS